MSAYIITGANGDIGISIAFLLKEMDPTAKIIGTDVKSKWPALGTFFDEVELIPRAEEEGYIERLACMVTHYNAVCIIPTSEPELRWLSKNKDQASKIPIFMNAPDLILNCMDKLECTRWLVKIGITPPKTFEFKNAKESDIPFIVKPRFGAGARNIHIINTSADLNALKSQNFNEEMIGQEYIDAPEDEYTCVIVKSDVEHRIFTMHRRLKEGVTFEMQGIKNAEIDNVLNRIAENIPSFSNINVQLRLQGKIPFIFEINPRLSSTVKMRHMLGFSDFLWLLGAKFYKKPFPAINPVLNKKVYRIYAEVMEN